MDYMQVAPRSSFAFSAENPTGARNGGSKGADCEKLRPCIDIAPGETALLCDTDGPGILTHIWFTGYVGHGFILRIYWDNAEQPSVEAPISAFFGCAYDEQFADRDGRYPVLNSAMVLVAPGRGLNCYWQMPFRKHCRVTMENRGNKPETLYYMISGWKGEIPVNSGYFHALYRQEHPVQKGRAYTAADGIHGEGVFVGLSTRSRRERQQHLLGRGRTENLSGWRPISHAELHRHRGLLLRLLWLRQRYLSATLSDLQRPICGAVRHSGRS